MPKPSSSRQKGRSFEKKVVEILRVTFDLDEDHIWPAPASVSGMDVKLSKLGKKTVGLAIECKNVRNLNIFKAIAQAKKNTPDSLETAVVFHQSIPGNREIWIVVPFEHYLQLRTP